LVDDPFFFDAVRPNFRSDVSVKTCTKKKEMLMKRSLQLQESANLSPSPTEIGIGFPYIGFAMNVPRYQDRKGLMKSSSSIPLDVMSLKKTNKRGHPSSTLPFVRL